MGQQAGGESRRANGFLVLLAIVCGLFAASSLRGGRVAQPIPAAPASLPVAYASLPAAKSSTPATQPRVLDPLPERVEAPSPTPALAELRTLYIQGHKVPLRGEPRAGSPILDRLGPGQAVAELEARQDWTRVRDRLTQREGWVQGKRLSDKAPAEPEPKEAKPPSIGLTLSAAAIGKVLIAASIARYPGPCACPYHSARNGSSCGRRAAYVRPGGYAPLCYAKDITPEMVAEYRASH